MIYKHSLHELDPIYDKKSRILILGSFPSVLSLKENFYYANPRNRFWSLMESIYNEKKLESIEDKKLFLIRNNIALFDVIKSCEIHGSSDSSIKNIEYNNLSEIIENSMINTIILNGNKAFNTFEKYKISNPEFCSLISKIDNIKIINLPSTSPANAQYSFKDLLKLYMKALFN